MIKRVGFDQEIIDIQGDIQSLTREFRSHLDQLESNPNHNASRSHIARLSAAISQKEELLAKLRRVSII